MLMLSLPAACAVGDTVPVKINGRPAEVTWRDPDTLVVGADDPRPILSEAVSDGLRHFLAGHRGSTADDYAREGGLILWRPRQQ
jgi:hypothetical protein